MSSNKIYNRLESLFSDLEDQIEPNFNSLKAENLSGWTWQCNPLGEYTACGSEIEQALGFSPEEVIHEKVYLLGLDTDSSILLKNLISSKTPNFEEELIYITPGGNKLNVRVTGLSNNNSEGTFLGWTGFSSLLSPSQLLSHYQSKNSTFPIDNSRSNGLKGQKDKFENRDKAKLSETSFPIANSDLREQLLMEEETTIVSGSESQASNMVVPFTIGKASRGLFEIQDTPGREWTEDEEALVKEVARQLALALENANLYHDLKTVANDRQKFLLQAERRALELEAAAEIARDTTQTLSLDELLRQIVDLVHQRFGFYQVSIFLIDEDGEYAVVRESTGPAGEELKRRGHKLAVGSKSIIGTATARKEPYIVNDVSNHPNYYANPLLPNTKSEMGIPLRIGERVIGALDVQTTTPNPFTEDVVNVLQIISDQVAVAIENARAYELSQKALLEMQEVDRMKSQFLANMSHELRTPLNSIIGFSKVILKGIDGPINEIQSQDLTAIHNSGQHLLNLINDILDLSKIEAGKMTLSYTDLDIKEIARSVMSTATGLVKDKPIHLKNLIQDDLPPVKGDQTRVRQVLLNLVSNAAKFTEEGSITLEAKEITSDGNYELMITVKDTGIGIAEMDRHKLFQEFSQVDDSPTRKSGGSGLGLSICRSLIEMHGGRIGLLESKPDEGSTFFFTLPLENPTIKTEPDLAKKIILAIEEDPEILRVYQRYLEATDFIIENRDFHSQLLDEIRNIQPECVLLDISSRKFYAWKLIRDLSENQLTSSIPVLVCSMTDEKEKAFSYGVKEYLLKPFLQDEFIQSIHRIENGSKDIGVLFISPSQENSQRIHQILASLPGYIFQEANRMDEVMSVLTNQSINVIILDLTIPEKSGFDFLRELQNQNESSKIPKIVVSRAELASELQKEMPVNCQWCISSDFLRSGELIRAIHNALKH